MKNKQVTLIVGADSTIGGALLSHLQRAGEWVIGTTRRRGKIDKNRIYLDLSDSVKNWHFTSPIGVAILCAGVTKLDECRRNPTTTAFINVDAVSELVKNLVANGAFVIYLSSNEVFDGSVPYSLPEDPLSPQTEYGRQKAEVENRIRGESLSIVRFTKVLEPTVPLFSEWSEALRNKTTIQPFADLFMAPITLACAVSVLRLVADLRLPGILQVSGERDISYAEACSLGAMVLGADPNLVQPVWASESGRFKEPIPVNTTLNVDRLRSVIGMEPPDVDWTIEALFTRA